MIRKQYKIDGIQRNFCCYTVCPNEAGLELCTVVNEALERLNKFLDDTYNAYKVRFPKVTRPVLYIYLREDNLKDINGFTDGRDIYLSVASIIGMSTYIGERLNTKKFNGEELIPEDLLITTHLRIYDYVLKLIIAHEMIHIWHSHRLWPRNTRSFEQHHDPIIADDVFSEKVFIAELDRNLYTEDHINTIIENTLQSGLLNQSNQIVERFFKQVLEIDADCGAVCLVLLAVYEEMKSIVQMNFKRNEDERSNIGALISLHSYLLGLVIGAAGLMCGFFDSRHPGTSFDKLSYLLSSDHPIHAIRFFKMSATLNEMIHTFYDDDTLVEALLSKTDDFSVDIFMHKDKTMDLRNCFWAAAHTQEAQEYITMLEHGWNLIHDSLQTVSLIDLPQKFSAEDLLIPESLIWYDINGDLICK